MSQEKEALSHWGGRGSRGEGSEPVNHRPRIGDTHEDNEKVIFDILDLLASAAKNA